MSISGVHNLKRYDNICELSIAGVLDSFDNYTPKNYQLNDYNTVFIIMLSKDMYKKEIESEPHCSSYIYLSTDKPYEIDRRIDELKDLIQTDTTHISGENLYEEKLEKESMTKLIRLILYIIDIMITLFCMVNIFYIISSSTVFRKKDFAVLRSAGMSERQIDKMLTLEGILYGFSGIVLGTLASLAFLYVIGQIIIDTDLYLVRLPFIQIIYVAIIVYTVIFFAIMSARKKIKKRNIIEDVKVDTM